MAVVVAAAVVGRGAAAVVVAVVHLPLASTYTVKSLVPVVWCTLLRHPHKAPDEVCSCCFVVCCMVLIVG